MCMGCTKVLLSSNVFVSRWTQLLGKSDVLCNEKPEWIFNSAREIVNGTDMQLNFFLLWSFRESSNMNKQV